MKRIDSADRSSIRFSRSEKNPETNSRFIREFCVFHFASERFFMEANA